MPARRSLRLSQLTEPAHTTPPPYQPITLPPQRINFDALKASILAGLIKDTATFRMMLLTTMPMLTTQPTTMTETTKTTKKTMSRKLPAIASTAQEPQPLRQSTADVADDVEDDFPMMLQTMMPTKPMAADNKMTKRTVIGDPSTLCKPQLLMQSTVDVLDDVHDFPPPATMILTMTPMTVHTKTTEKMKTKIDNAPAIASTLHKPQPVMQFTGVITYDVEDNFLM